MLPLLDFSNPFDILINVQTVSKVWLMPFHMAGSSLAHQMGLVLLPAQIRPLLSIRFCLT